MFMGQRPSRCKPSASLVRLAMEKVMKKKSKTRATDELAGPDRGSLARTGDDLALELHGYGNALHKAGLHRQGTAADVAAGMIETIVEELRNGG